MRRRTVVRAEQRAVLVDRVVAVVVALLLVTGLVAILPPGWQDGVSRGLCRVGTLGLTNCEPRLYDAEQAELGEPRCQGLADLDDVVPEVVSQSIPLAGGTLHRQVTRDGTTIVTPAPAGTAPGATVPALWRGQERGRTELLEAVDVPLGVRWEFLDGDGEEEMLVSLQERHDNVLQRRSALSLGVADPDSPEVAGRTPAPTTILSRVEPGAVSLPLDSHSRRLTPEAGHVVATRDGDVHLRVDTLRSVTWTSTGLAATTDEGDEVSGWLRWGRDESGQLTDWSTFLVSAGPLSRQWQAPGETVDVTYVHLPLSTEDEHEVVESWLSDHRGARLPLSVLTRAAAPGAGDRMEALLAAASTVTTITLTGADLNEVSATLGQQVRSGLRVGWPAETDVSHVDTVQPAPGGGPRSVSREEQCG